MMKLAWLTDLHLELLDTAGRQQFYETLRNASFDAAVVTGDISEAERLPEDLLELGRACAPRSVYFVLGNHDFHGSSFAVVDAGVADVCIRQGNLHHLGQGETIRLTSKTALIGHRGWADGRAGYGVRSVLKIKDAFCIDDFRSGSKEEVFSKMKSLGMASGEYFRGLLPYALQCYDHVIVATHVPPFTQAATYSGQQCGPLHLPHYSNISAGGVIQGIAGNFRNRRVTVLCGHTHDRAAIHIRPDIRVYAGAARPGKPQIQRVFDVEAVA